MTKEAYKQAHNIINQIENINAQLRRWKLNSKLEKRDIIIFDEPIWYCYEEILQGFRAFLISSMEVRIAELEKELAQL